MIHPDSVRAWEADIETFRKALEERNVEIKRLHIACEAYSRRINELEGALEEERKAHQQTIRDYRGATVRE